MSSPLKSLQEKHPDVAGFTLQGQNQAVLCLHGFTSTPQTFSEFARLAHQVTGFHIEVPCLPGHGNFPADLQKVQYQDWFEFALREYEKLRKDFEVVHLVGFSMGGLLCQWIAQQNSFKDGSLNLIAPALLFHGKWLRLRYFFVALLPKWITKRWMVRKKRIHPENISYRNCLQSCVVECYKAGKFMEKNMQGINIPCLIQVASNETVIDSKSSHILYKVNKGSVLKTYNNGEHILLQSNVRQEVTKNIIDMIKKVPPLKKG